MIGKFKKLHWTSHSQFKMKQYGLSKNKLILLLRKPERSEEGIVPGTVAIMMTNKKYGSASRLPSQFKNFLNRKTPGEIWLMYKDTETERKIISTWRYPGISKAGEAIPIPEEIRRELLNEL